MDTQTILINTVASIFLVVGLYCQYTSWKFHKEFKENKQKNI